jgi:hypothetical protein
MIALRAPVLGDLDAADAHEDNPIDAERLLRSVAQGALGRAGAVRSGRCEQDQADRVASSAVPRGTGGALAFLDWSEVIVALGRANPVPK